MPDLTPREREVALLAGAGLSNRQIADRLFIEVGTVKNTLRSAYRKLPAARGHHKRMVIVAWLYRQERAANAEISLT